MVTTKPKSHHRRPLWIGLVVLLLCCLSAFRQSTMLFETSSKRLSASDVTIEATTTIVAATVTEDNNDGVVPQQDLRHTADGNPVSSSNNNRTNIMLTEESPTDELKLAWLLSFPNSGTSYTMLLVERASQLSTATHHGKEIETSDGMSIPVFENMTEEGGPYWEGLVNVRGTKRPLPQRGYVLTKSHCGSRCANCGFTQYKTPLSKFIMECQKTTGYWKRAESGQKELVTSYVPLEKVAKVIWLMRHPLENIVSRYHLERRNWMKKAQKDPSAEVIAQQFYTNATGFRNWCRYLDETFDADGSATMDKTMLPVSWSLWSRVPCRGEFFKYTQWHNHVSDMVQGENAILKDLPMMHWYYENYDDNNGSTPNNVTSSTLPVDQLLQFLRQDRVGPIKPFRTPMPIYRLTHYTMKERQRIWRLLEAVATPSTWSLLRRYHADHKVEDH